MNAATFHLAGRALTLGVICMVAVLATAQTEPATSVPATSGQQAGNQQNPQAGNQSIIPDATSPLLYSPSLDQPGIKDLGGGDSWFSENVRLFAFGPVAVRSAELFYGYSSANSGAGVANRISSGILQTNLAYSKRLRRNLLVWQYNPRLLYGNGQISLAAENQDASFNTLFAPTPHVTLGVQEGFSFFGPLNTFNNKTLAGSTTTAVSNPFLAQGANSSQQTWVDSISIPIIYTPSLKTTIQATPLFNYSRTTEGNAAPAGSAAGGTLSSLDYGTRVQMSHSLSLNQTIGMFYSYQVDRQTGVAGTTFLNSFGASISRRVGPSLLVSGDVGGSHYSGLLLTGWTMVGSISLSKVFQHGTLQANYGRDTSFTGIVGSSYNNHSWAAYSREIGRRAKWNMGAGFLNSAVSSERTNGKYVTTGLTYTLTSNLTWTLNYLHLWQTEVVRQLVNGSQTQFQFGLRWVPKVRPEGR